MAIHDSHDREIAMGFLFVSAFVLLGKFAGAAKEAAIAWRYGINPTIDAYAFVLNIVTCPISVWFSILTMVLVPMQAKMTCKDNADLTQFNRELLGFSLMLGCGLAVLSYWSLPLVMQHSHTGLTDTARHEAELMAKTLVWLLPAGFAVSLLSAWLLAGGKHHNTLLEATPAAIILCCVLAPTNWLAQPLPTGTMLGFAAHLLLLTLALRKERKMTWPTIGFRSPAWKTFWHGMGLIAIGQLAMGLTGIVDQIYAAQLGTGTIATLSYANRTLALILSMCVLAISRATLPTFSKVNAAADHPQLMRLTMRWAKIAFAIGLVTATAAWLLAPTFVRFYFERGAFDTRDTDAVSNAFQYGLLQIPFYISGIVIYASNSSQQKYKMNGIAMLASVIAKVLFLCAPTTSLNINNIQLSTLLMYFVFFMVLAIWSDRSPHGTK